MFSKDVRSNSEKEVGHEAHDHLCGAVYHRDVVRGSGRGGTSATTASGINTRGDVVGSYTDTGPPHMIDGFLLRHGHIRTIDYPGAMFTTLRGIHNKGDIVGTAQFTPSLPGGDFHGFVLRAGEFTDVQFPGHLNTIAVAVTDRGDVVGCYHDH